MSILTTCKDCGAEFEADSAAITAGVWRSCPACRLATPPAQLEGGKCQDCGRALRDPKRTICLRCAGIGVS